MLEKPVSLEEIKTDLRRFFEARLVADGLAFGDDDSLIELGIDSSAVMEILLHVERRHGLMLPDSELTPDNIRNLSALAHCVQRTIAASPLGDSDV